jgi:hypothetical protein
MARAESLGFTFVPGVVCLRKLTDPEHRHQEDSRTDAEYDRLERQKCPYLLGMDHSRLWRTSAGGVFATADPYHLDLDKLDELRARAAELGLTVAVTSMTMYAPGYTLMVLVTPPGVGVRIDLGSRAEPKAAG